MKKLKRLLSTLLLVILISCNKNTKEIFESPVERISVTQEEYNSIFTKSGDEISRKEMIKLIERFVEQASNKNLTTKSTTSLKGVNITPLQIKTKSSTNELVLPIYSIVTVNANGDSTSNIISADARLPIVLAHINGSRDFNRADVPEGVKLLVNSMISSYKDKLAIVSTINDSLQKVTVSKIALKLSKKPSELTLDEIRNSVDIKDDIVVKSPIMQNPEASYPQFYVVNRYNPFLQTAWDQGMPYNRLMPQSCPDNWLWDYRYAIPSSAIAIAQILAFYQPSVIMNGVSMNWPYLTENQEIYEESDYFGNYVQDPLEKRNMVAELMKGIIQQCNISYTCTSSSMSVTPVRNYLSTFQITMGNETGYWWDPIRNSISNFKPALLYGQTEQGQGHFMLVDGGMVMKSRNNPTSPINYYVVHVNMGMGKAYNGYYLMGDYRIEPGFATFTKNWKLLPDITMNYTY